MTQEWLCSHTQICKANAMVVTSKVMNGEEWVQAQMPTSYFTKGN